VLKFLADPIDVQLVGGGDLLTRQRTSLIYGGFQVRVVLVSVHV
jgi:hypothetical protein